MITKILWATALSLGMASAQAQEKFFTKSGKISFFSKAPLEDIEAKNKTVAAVLDTKSGALQFSALMKSFEFEKALMQEHFNENYVESDQYPKADFRGAVVNNAEIPYGKDGQYKALVKGKLTLHGVSRDVETTGTITVAGGKMDAGAVFTLQLSDYNIAIPAVVKDKIANAIRIAVDCKLEPLK